jgi:RNA polymerase sigma factor (sigma-70 family)
MSTVKVFNTTNDPLKQELAEIFRQHSRLVYRTAYSVTGRSQDAEDILQSLFLHLLRRGCPPGLKENPQAYLYRSAINLSLNAVKSRQRELVPKDVETPAEPATDFPTRHLDIQERLVSAMSQLHPGAVEMLILRYEHNYTDVEIGKLLGKSRGVVAVTLNRARARLKKLLSGGTL